MTMVSGRFGGGAGGAYPGSAARHHKLVCISAHGEEFAPAQVEMLGAFAGADVGGSYASSTPLDVNTVAAARDGNFLTAVRLSGTGGEITADHGAPALVMEIMLKAPASAAERMPATLRFYESGDGAAWTLLREWAQPAWAAEEERYFAIADESLAGWAGRWRHHRIQAQATADGSHFALAELGWLAQAGDTASAPGTVRAGALAAGYPASLADGDWLTFAAVALTGGFFDHDAGRTPIAQLAEVYLQARAGSWSSQAPAAFTVAGSNWAADYATLSTNTGLPAWGSGQARRYAI